jgi:hypothetical protein
MSEAGFGVLQDRHVLVEKIMKDVVNLSSSNCIANRATRADCSLRLHPPPPSLASFEGIDSMPRSPPTTSLLQLCFTAVPLPAFGSVPQVSCCLNAKEIRKAGGSNSPPIHINPRQHQILSDRPDRSPHDRKVHDVKYCWREKPVHGIAEYEKWR